MDNRDRELILMKEQMFPNQKYNLNVIPLAIDSTRNATIAVAGTPSASITVVKGQNLQNPSQWVDIFPQGQTLSIPGGGSGHILFAATNNGIDGNIYGKLIDDTGAVLIPQSNQFAVHGALMYWETDFTMPFRNYTLTCEAGH